MQEYGREHRPLLHKSYFSKRTKRRLLGIGIATYLGILAFGCEKAPQPKALEDVVEDSAYVHKTNLHEYRQCAPTAQELSALYGPAHH